MVMMSRRSRSNLEFPGEIGCGGEKIRAKEKKAGVGPLTIRCSASCTTK